MARTGKLSAVEVAKAKGPTVLHDGGGLYLRISAPPAKAANESKAPTGSKSWVFRFQLDGKRRDMGLGAYPDLSLAAARDKAAELRRQHQEGVDPMQAREAARKAEKLAEAHGRTFKECAADFVARNKAAWRNAKHRQQWERTLATYVYKSGGVDYRHAAGTLRDVWLPGDDFYATLQCWRDAFVTEWEASPKIRHEQPGASLAGLHEYRLLERPSEAIGRVSVADGVLGSVPATCRLSVRGGFVTQ